MRTACAYHTLDLGIMEGLSVSAADLAVYIHPSQSKNVSRAILRELSSLLFKYNESFGGVVLAYDFNTPDKLARILSAVHPYFGVKLKATLLLFSPKPDMLLEGKVVKVSPESIHVVILGFSSAIITEQDIRNEFKYKTKHGEGLYVSRNNKKHVIKVGDMIRFLVKSLDEEILLMSGSLIPENTGNIHWLDKYFLGASTDSGTMKRAKTDEETEAQMHATSGGEAVSLDNGHPIQKSKKRRVGEDQ